MLFIVCAEELWWRKRSALWYALYKHNKKTSLYLRRGQLVSATLSRSFIQDISQQWVPAEFSFFVYLRLEDILEQNIQGGSFWLH